MYDSYGSSASEFRAKFASAFCARCGQRVVVGQLLRYTGSGKTIVHVGVCPPKPEGGVVFRYPDGCRVGGCTHGADEELARIEANLRSSRLGTIVSPDDCVDAQLGAST